jgi:hypothetical protein
MKPDEYEIASVEDMLRLPDDAYERFKEEMPLFLDSMRAFLKTYEILAEANGERAEWKIPKSVWVDDNENKITLNVVRLDSETAPQKHSKETK